MLVRHSFAGLTRSASQPFQHQALLRNTLKRHAKHYGGPHQRKRIVPFPLVPALLAIPCAIDVAGVLAQIVHAAARYATGAIGHVAAGGACGLHLLRLRRVLGESGGGVWRRGGGQRPSHHEFLHTNKGRSRTHSDLHVVQRTSAVCAFTHPP
jgi:hypothetical protein